MRKRHQHEADRCKQHRALAQGHVVNARGEGGPVALDHFAGAACPEERVNSTKGRLGSDLPPAALRRIYSLANSRARSASSERKRARYAGTRAGRVARPAMESSPWPARNWMRVGQAPS